MNTRRDLIRRRQRRGVIFIVVMGVIVILAALALVFAQQMRTEALASVNRLSAQQADAVEFGAEQWVLANVQKYQTDAYDLTTNVPASALPVGNGYFWVLQFNSQTDQQYQFGITDESSKLNLNSASGAELAALPTTLMQQPIADAITDWRNPPNKATADGAQSAYYNTLQEPYNCKNAPFETVEEVLLVKGVTPQLLFGGDMNRNGAIEQAEAANAAASGINLSLNTTTTNDSRGIFNYLTVYSTQPAGAVRTLPGVTGRISPVGMINVNTAPLQVLMCLPGMTQATAQAIINARAGNANSPNAGWVQNVVPANIYALIASYITTTSYQYSADIVAVSSDARSFKRVRIVVDCQQTPSKIVYRKDLTSLGWPLPQDVHDSMRAGKGVPSYITGNTANLTGGGQMVSP